MNKTTYYLRIRASDKDPWGEPEPFSTKTERDKAAKMARIKAGFRVYSYEEKNK